MTVTVKLDAAMEAQLRRCAAGSGRSTSEVVRAALDAYLSAPEAAADRSAFALGRDLFGRHAGGPGLSQDRKRLLADAWATKQSAPRR